MPPDNCENLVNEVEKEIQGSDGEVCYTLYEYTCADTDSGAIYRQQTCTSDGLKIVTTKAYNDFVDPVPWDGGGGTHVDVEQTKDYDANGQIIYIKKRVYAPQDYTTHETMRHKRLGEIELTSNATIKVVKQPMAGVINVTTDVSYSNAPGQGNQVEEVLAAPELTEALLLPNGSQWYSRKTYSDYKATSNTVTVYNKKVDGVPTKECTRTLTAHETSSGNPSIISVSERRIYSCGSSGIYERVEIQDDSAV